jgi:hypothetical protein
MKHNWSAELFNYYRKLKPSIQLPNNVEWLYPQQHAEVLDVLQTFLLKYYNDKNPRTLLLGINPGRFGAGVTGVNFTAPRQLTEDCFIPHSFKQQSELSAEFIYEMIHAFGSVEGFYAKHFIGSVCPLGFVKEGKNINYYDDKALQAAVEPFIVKSMKALSRLNFNKQKCICIGGEKNYKYLASLNSRYEWFDQIVSVPHPRFIMQYRRKQKAEYMQHYLDVLKK